MIYGLFRHSLRNVPDLLHECGVKIRDEIVVFWWHSFGPVCSALIRSRRLAGMKPNGWRWHPDGMFVNTLAKRHSLMCVPYTKQVRRLNRLVSDFIWCRRQFRTEIQT